MEMNDMVIISVDDHISEPPDTFQKHLSGRDLETAPKFCTTTRGTNYWEYFGIRMPAIGLNAVVGRVPEEYGMEPTSLSQLRAGCYNVHARIDDMRYQSRWVRLTGCISRRLTATHSKSHCRRAVSVGCRISSSVQTSAINNTRRGLARICATASPVMSSRSITSGDIMRMFADQPQAS